MSSRMGGFSFFRFAPGRASCLAGNIKLRGVPRSRKTEDSKTFPDRFLPRCPRQRWVGRVLAEPVCRVGVSDGFGGRGRGPTENFPRGRFLAGRGLDLADKKQRCLAVRPLGAVLAVN